jgi:two-component system, response regulator
MYDPNGQVGYSNSGKGATMDGNLAEYLMIEDNGYDVQIALFDLEAHGLVNKFHIARDGADALDYLFGEDGSLRINPPKVIFLDFHMPKISGLELLRRLKSNEQTKSIPVVVLKSSISPRDVAECQRLGVSAFIEKPLEYENFIHTIKNIDK